MKNHRILLSIKSLHVEGGGAERVFVDLANYLAESGWIVHVVTLDYQARSFYSLNPQVVFHALQLNHPGTPTSPSALFKFIIKNRRLANSLKPDVYISFMHSLYVPAQLSMIGSGIPFVASEHFRASYEYSKIQNVLVRWASRFHFLKTVPSQTVFNDLNHWQRRKAKVLPNPVDDRFFLENTPHDRSSHPLKIVCVGRLMFEKNHIELFEAVSSIRESFSGWTLDLFGDGVDRRALEAKVSQLGLESIVRFMGFTSALEFEYAGAEFTVIPSLYESFGLAAAESLAAGCPVLAFDCCQGVGELVRHGENGLIVQSEGNRIELLAHSIQKMMSDADLRSELAANSSKSVEHLKRNDVMQKWEHTLTRIVEST